MCHRGGEGKDLYRAKTPQVVLFLHARVLLRVNRQGANVTGCPFLVGMRVAVLEGKSLYKLCSASHRANKEPSPSRSALVANRPFPSPLTLSG